MRHGSILPGQERFDLGRWRNDILEECHYDDKIWGYACRGAEELQIKSVGDYPDPVLFNLFRMGTWDWDGENKQMNQSTQAMRHATAMAMRLHYMIQEQDSNVSILLIVVEEVTDDGDSIRSSLTRLMRPSKACRTSGVEWLTRYRRSSDRL
jgi:hypothetical protein